MKRYLLSLLLLGCFAWPGGLSAWSRAGHEVIAAIAYQQLDPAVKAVVNRWSRPLSHAQKGIARLMFLAAWPDRIRDQKAARRYRAWHMVPYPWSLDGQSLPPLSQPNLLTAMLEQTAILQKANVPVLQRAKALAFVAHLAGDAHQPLHCAERFSQRFPGGDGGGNGYRLRHYYWNLHRYWDAGAGLLYTGKPKAYWRVRRQLLALAQRLMQRYPKAAFSARRLRAGPRQWSEESFALAKAQAYQVPFRARPTKAYKAMVQTLSARQLTLAGYRLGYWLNHHVRTV
jgi:hypothetical protein